jgi:two-component system cell cycle sensor histidine kinase PleC
MMRCVVDDDGNMVFVSSALGWSLGQSAAALTGRPAKSVIDIVGAPERLGKIESGLYEVALLRRTRDPLLVQARIDRVAVADDKTYTVVWCDPGNKLKDRKGDDARRAAHDLAVLAGGDAAEKGFAPDTAPLSNTDGELRHFLNLSIDLMAVYTRDAASCLRANPAFTRTMGLADGALKTQSFISLIHPDDRATALQAMQNVLHPPQDGGEARADFEARIPADDSSGAFSAPRRIAWTLKAAGRQIYVLGHDVSGTRQHEEELLRREQQLSEAEKIGHTGHWHWETADADGAMKDVMEWSDHLYTIFGVRKDSFAPTLDNVRAMVLKRDLAKAVRALLRARVRKKDFAFEFRLRRPGGTVRTLRCEGRCRLDARTGEVSAFYGIMQDITERTLHEMALRAAKEAAEQAYASKSRFLANMSHELRTPLNAIIGFSEMIQRQLLGPVGNPRYLDYVRSIRDSGDHLLDLINDILDMSKIEVGKYELHVEEINVGKVIRLAVHMVEGRAHDAQVRLATEGIEDDIHVRADRRAILQVVLNILSNAVKFTRHGGTVDVRCHRELNGAAIVVSDTGIGIPADKLAMVTRPFEQVDSEYTRAHEGSGLGLSITKELIEMHGGTMEIASEVGTGTTVSVLLPAQAVVKTAARS